MMSEGMMFVTWMSEGMNHMEPVKVMASSGVEPHHGKRELAGDTMVRENLRFSMRIDLEISSSFDLIMTTNAGMVRERGRCE